MAQVYYRPIVQCDALVPDNAQRLAGGPLWFTHAEKITRNERGLIDAADIPNAQLQLLTQARAPICELSLDQPRLMGVLNVTPDSFSDGGKFQGQGALDQADQMLADGADILDIGGESTRPGADFVPVEAEINRVLPAIVAINGKTVISIDTRKAEVARAATEAGAMLINDVSALQYDAAMLDVVKSSGAALCLMHASGDPKTMQSKLGYKDVLLDVYDYLEKRVAFCADSGIPRARIIVDPGVGFGKSLEHNLALIKGLSLFHGLGCAILLGVSRKRFIGTISGEEQADKRASGSIALGLEGFRQGVQMLRVHDIRETKQALALWQAIRI